MMDAQVNQSEAASHGVRLLTPEDLPWVAETTEQAYPGRVKDWPGFGRWYLTQLANPGMLFLRTKNAYVVTVLQPLFYDPVPIAIGLFVASDATVPFQTMAILRLAIEWAERQGAQVYEVGSLTAGDFAPFAHRLGEAEVHQVYRVRLATWPKAAA